jgi:xanthine dehydrogenase YagR molybdenum-binding subunit
MQIIRRWTSRCSTTPTKSLNEYGTRGVGEIGLAGIAPAVTAAVHHATGVRRRELLVSIRDLLTAQVPV